MLSQMMGQDQWKWNASTGRVRSSAEGGAQNHGQLGWHTECEKKGNWVSCEDPKVLKPWLHPGNSEAKLQNGTNGMELRKRITKRKEAGGRETK